MGILKKLICLSVFFIAAGISAFAEQITFQIVQVDASQTEINEKSYDIESYVLDGFFDKGFIVTTSEAAVCEADEDTAAAFKTGMNEAYDGSSKYFVQITLIYETTKLSTSSVSNIKKIIWTLSDTKTGLVKEKAESENITIKNGVEDLSSIAKSLVASINNAIKA